MPRKLPPKNYKATNLYRLGVPYRVDIEETSVFPYDGTSMYKGNYQIEKAKEIYTPDEAGHLPTVDYRTGVWLKDRNYPTSWKEFMHTQLNRELYNEVGSPYLNEHGRLQYPKGYNQNTITYSEWKSKQKK